MSGVIKILLSRPGKSFFFLSVSLHFGLCFSRSDMNQDPMVFISPHLSVTVLLQYSFCRTMCEGFVGGVAYVLCL